MDDTVLQDVADDADPVDAGLLLDERDGALWRAFSALGERCRRLLRVMMATPPPSYQGGLGGARHPARVDRPDAATLSRRVAQDRGRRRGPRGRPAGGLTMTDPDEELMGRLRRIADEVDAPPDLVAEAARGAFLTRRLDAELAELVSDSDLTTSGVRGAGPRALAFELRDLTLELQLEDGPDGLGVRGLVIGTSRPGAGRGRHARRDHLGRDRRARVVQRRRAPRTPAGAGADSGRRGGVDRLDSALTLERSRPRCRGGHGGPLSTHDPRAPRMTSGPASTAAGPPRR